MDKIEKIRQEIEKLKKDNEISEDKDYAQYELDVACGYDGALDDVLGILSTLESEKPMVQEGLEEEIDRLWGSFADEMEGPHNLFDIYARLARHFAQWQKEQMLKEAVEGKIEEVSFNNGELHNTIFFSFDEESLHVENRIWFPRCGKDGDKVRIIIVKEDRK